MTSESSSLAEAVRYECPAPHVALVTINRMAARNAIDAAVTAGLAQAVDMTESDEDVRVVVLTGAGTQAFSAGADLKTVADGGVASLMPEDGGFGGFVHRARTKPWIAAVNGFALAGGAEIALACDLIVASRNASFGLPEVRRGMMAMAGGVYRLPRVLPRALAIELILTGERMGAETALRFGLVNRLVDGTELLPEALRLAASICAGAPLAVRESLAIARDCFDLTDTELRVRSEQAGRRLAVTEDFIEGPRAFVEKRPAVWRGR